MTTTKTARMSTRVIATLDTADFTDCVNTGYTYTLYSDGHLSAQYRTCWQGSRSGQRWVTEPGYIEVSAIDASDADHDAEAMLTQAVQRLDPSDDRNFRMTRGGYVIR